MAEFGQFLMGVFLGLILIWGFSIALPIFVPENSAKELCEQNLPRTQSCKMVWVPDNGESK